MSDQRQLDFTQKILVTNWLTFMMGTAQYQIAEHSLWMFIQAAYQGFQHTNLAMHLIICVTLKKSLLLVCRFLQKLRFHLQYFLIFLFYFRSTAFFFFQIKSYSEALYTHAIPTHTHTHTTPLYESHILLIKISLCKLYIP